MAIRVPTTYTRQRSLPGSLGGQYTDLRPAAAVSRATVRAGQIIEQRARELTRERDETIALNAYNEFLDAARVKMRDEKDGLLNQTGESIYNLDDQYKEWFAEFKSEAMANRFDTNAQAKIFERNIEAQGQRDLNTVSKHIMAQHQANKKRSIENFMANAEAKVREDPSQLDQFTEDAIKQFNTTYPNRDNEAAEKKISGSLASAAVQEMIAKNPAIALEMIESRKEALGAAYTQWKNKAEAERDKQFIENLQIRAEKNHPNDYDAQVDWVLKQEGNRLLKNRAINSIKARKSDVERREKEARDDRRDVLYNDIFSDIRNGNFFRAIRTVGNADIEDLPEPEKFKIENVIKKQMKSGGSQKSNQETYRWLLDKAMLGKIGVEQIVQWSDKLSSEDQVRLRRIALDAQKTENKPYYDALNTASKYIKKQLITGTDFVPLGKAEGNQEEKDNYIAQKRFIEYAEIHKNAGENYLEFLDLNNPNNIVDQAMRGLLKSPEQKMMEQLQGVTAFTAEDEKIEKRKDGESLEDYLKRQ